MLLCYRNVGALSGTVLLLIANNCAVNHEKLVECREKSVMDANTK